MNWYLQSGKESDVVISTRIRFSRNLPEFKFNLKDRQEVENLKREVEKYKSLESTLQNTLVMAQSTAEDIKKVAHQEAEQIIKNAEAGARSAITDLNTL